VHGIAPVASLYLTLSFQDRMCLIERLDRVVLFVTVPKYAGETEHARGDLRFIPYLVEGPVGKIEAACAKESQRSVCQKVIAVNIFQHFSLGSCPFECFNCPIVSSRL